MVGSIFDGILKDLEVFFNCPLHADTNQSCLVEMGFGISLQMELNPQEQLVIGSIVGILPFGGYRDRLIKQALKSNYSAPSSGVFGYNIKTNHLILFISINPTRLTKEKIYDKLPPFIEKAKLWKETIEAGEMPIVEEPTIPTDPSRQGLFGFIR